MVTCLIRVTEKYIDSKSVSVQQEHVELYTQGKLCGIVLADKEFNVIKEYKADELSRLIGSAISNGRRQGTNWLTGEPEFYYLGDR